MKAVFIDSTAFYAELDGTDPNHPVAAEAFERAVRERWALLTTNYVLHESWAVIQARLGWQALDAWRDRLVPACELVWVDRDLQRLGEARCRQGRLRGLSLTDCISFEVMRNRGVAHALAFDEHFAREGFRLP